MATKVVNLPSYVEALNKSGLKNRSNHDYYSCLSAEIYNIEDDKVTFRNYMTDIEYYEYAFVRHGKGNVEFIYVTYGVDI